MSRGYRFLIIAACGLVVSISLATGAYFGALYAPDHKQYQTVAGNQRGPHDYRGPTQSLPDISGLPGPVERAIANPEPATGQDHEKRDLAAQEASAMLAFWMVMASIGSVLITAVGTTLLYKQIVLTREAVEDTGKATKAMERQNDIAEDTSTRQLRAYVSVTPKTIGGFDPPGVIQVQHDVVNHGQTPAKNINHEFEMAVLPAKLPPLFTFPKPSRKVELNTTLFPGIVLKIWQNHKLQLSQDEVDSIVLHLTHRFYIWGVVYYQDAFNTAWETEFSASLGGPDYSHNILNLRSGGQGLPFSWLYGDGHNRAS